MADIQTLIKQLKESFAGKVQAYRVEGDELTIEIQPEALKEVCINLRDLAEFSFESCIDVCGVDYLHYGCTEWSTEETTSTGYSRAADKTKSQRVLDWDSPRFAVVYHLLSYAHNHRLRLRVFVDEATMRLPSLIDVWPCADWFEREAFDLFGFLFEGHPDLRRILTDYGFVGHPFRKDFPLIGHVEMRYDAAQQRCVYEPVSIESRTLVPKVIRSDSRYLHPDEGAGETASEEAGRG